eukprot:TRINITY_DN6822_c0_g1_i1.p1 TRINITY_DN6822_c0_g1~~TRINITY_DN6822_c0_g1_i1.p1  ORF type:complete len:572 (+),score=148.36 TRINITY_DN6822_c0_g1_i1:71-1786(+)
MGGRRYRRDDAELAWGRADSKVRMVHAGKPEMHRIPTEVHKLPLRLVTAPSVVQPAEEPAEVLRQRPGPFGYHSGWRCHAEATTALPKWQKRAVAPTVTLPSPSPPASAAPSPPSSPPPSPVLVCRSPLLAEAPLSTPQSRQGRKSSGCDSADARQGSADGSARGLGDEDNGITVTTASQNTSSSNTSTASHNISSSGTSPERMRPAHSDLCHALTREISGLANLLRLTPAEHQARHVLAAKVRSALAVAMPGVTTRVYGSWAADLALPTSDVDIAVSGAQDLSLQLPRVAKTVEALGLSCVLMLPGAAVPLLKFRDPSGLVCDVAFNVAHAEGSVRLTQETLQSYRGYHIADLILVVKLLIHCAGLNEVFRGGLSSYGLHLMVTAFLRRAQSRGDPPNLGELFLGFLGHYGSGGTFSPGEHTVNCLSDDGMDAGVIPAKRPRPGAVAWCVRDPLSENNVTEAGFRLHEVSAMLSEMRKAIMDAHVGPSPGCPLLCAAADACVGRIAAGALASRIADRAHARAAQAQMQERTASARTRVVVRPHIVILTRRPPPPLLTQLVRPTHAFAPRR